MGVSNPKRILIFVAVAALHLAFIAVVFIETTRERKRLATDEGIVSILIYLPGTSPKAAPAVVRTALRVPATAPSLREPVSEALQRPNEPLQQQIIDWTAAAHQAARELLAAEAAERARNGKMATGWWLAQEAKQRHRAMTPAFPWSHQPLTSWVDVDPDSYVITFRSGRCQLSIFLVVAGFGCALGHLDPEPGRADLFDPKYRATPIELPATLGEDADN
ncbi:MAG TPA: hypothetical protein VF848_05100 [Steroidobacteraceae bacterium]